MISRWSGGSGTVLPCEEPSYGDPSMHTKVLIQEAMKTRYRKFLTNCGTSGSAGCIGIRQKDIVHEAFETNVSFQGGKFSVYRPWIWHYKLLQDNYENSVARVSSQMKRS